MTRRSLLIVIAVLGVGLTALAGLLVFRSQGEGNPVNSGDPAETVVELLRNPVDVAPFSVTDLSGRTMNSADWRGKVVLINFWATWCPPCLAEIPDLIALQEKYREQLIVIGISEDEDPPESIKRFAAEKEINYPIVMSTPELQKLFPGVMALPTTFVLDREGRMAKKRVGLLNARESEAATRALAGLSVDARIELTDDPGKLSVEHAAQITEIPGIDLAGFPGPQKTALIQALNSETCTCGCQLSVAKCRVDDPTCAISLPAAKKIVEQYAAASLAASH